MGKYTRTLMDYDSEVSTVQVYATDLSEANIAAQITLQSNFGAAINGMSTGSLQKIEYGNVVSANNPAPPDPFAQRELKWRVDYSDDVTGEKGYFTVPCANAARLDPNNRGKAEIGDGAQVDAFVTATEAYVLSKAGNAITVLQIVLVGRNI